VTPRTYSANVPRFFVYRAGVSIAFWLPIWVIYYQQRGLNLVEIGLLESATWIISAFADIPTGALADRYGRKVCMSAGALLSGVAVIVITLPVPPLSPVFLTAAILWPVAFTLINGADTALLYESLHADGRGHDYARVLGTTTAVQQGTQGITSLVGAWFATFDITLAFTLTGICGILAGGLALTLREPPREAPTEPRAGYWTTLKRGIGIALEQPAVRYQVLFSAVTQLFPFMITFALFQPYATEVGLPIWMLGPLALVMRGGAMAGSLLAHRIGALVGAPTVIVVAPLTIVASLALLGLAPVPFAVLLFVVIAFANAVLRPPLSDLLNRSIPASERATILSLDSVVMTGLLAVIEPAVFAIATVATLALALGFASVCVLAVAGALLALWWVAQPEVAPVPLR
jgi:sugar phosphate permease